MTPHHILHPYSLDKPRNVTLGIRQVVVPEFRDAWHNEARQAMVTLIGAHPPPFESSSASPVEAVFLRESGAASPNRAGLARHARGSALQSPPAPARAGLPQSCSTAVRD